jgi:membrane-associated phospholipid phosphatase
MRFVAQVLMIILTLTTSVHAFAQTEATNGLVTSNSVDAEGSMSAEMPRLDLTLPSAHGGSEWRSRYNPIDPMNPTYVRESAIYRVPVSLSEMDQMLAVSTIGATILAFASERELLEFVQNNNGKVGNRLARFAEPFGGQLAGTGLIAGEIYALVAGPGETAEFFNLAFRAGLATGIVNNAIKLSLQRSLPSDSNDPFSKSPSKRPSDLAFPSSHASSAFSLATVVAETYGRENKVIPILAYGTAALTAWSRVYDNQHWVSDVIAGAFLGHLVAKQFFRKDTNGGIIVTPFFMRGTAGFQLSYSEKESWSQTRPKECRRRTGDYANLEACLAASLRK